MADENNQDQLADEWEQALSESGDLGGDQDDSGDDSMGGDDLGDLLAEAGGGDDLGLGDEGGGDQDALADEWAAALADTEVDNLKEEKEQEYLSSQSHEADFKDLTQEAKSPRPDKTKRDLDFILDIPLEVSAELGRTKLLINELLQLGQGSVIELNKLAGEPLEIYVNGKLVARGEAVVINEKFGIRLTDIISPIERVKQLS
jgi:flagellar motor switch protein FliN/FliY